MDEQRSSWQTEFAAARQWSDRVFDAVAPAAMHARPIDARHRLIFYLGHVEAFDWNQIGAGALGRGPVDAHFDRLFERGIDPPPGSLPQDAAGDWPALSEVRAYVRQVRERLGPELESASPAALHIALEHRLMHVETLGYLLHQLDPVLLRAWPQAPAPDAPPPVQRWVEVPAQRVRLGREHDGRFGWDNEFGGLEVDVPAFAVQQFKLSNRDWLNYVAQGGAPAPFWRQRGSDWTLKTVFGEIDLPLSWPVWIDQQSAAAFARDHGWALPSEAQWVAAANLAQTPDPLRDNFGLRRADPVPVNAGFAAGSDAPHQMVGNGWEWTSTVFGPWPGFAPQPGYPGYSADFFDGAHFVMRGAAPLTHERLARPGFRNWFRADYPYVHAGARCVANP